MRIVPEAAPGRQGGRVARGPPALQAYGAGVGAGRPTRALAAAGVAALVVAVLLTRGGTAAQDGDLAAPPPATAGFPVVPPDPGPAPSIGPTDVGLDGIDDARLGPRPPVTQDGGGWRDLGVTSTDGRCSLLWHTAGTRDLEVTGWQVGERIVSVAMRAVSEQPPDLASAWGTSFGDDLEVVDSRAPAVLTEEPLTGAVLDSVRSVSLVRDGIEVVFSDVGGTAGIDYVEVREPEGRECRAERSFWEPQQARPAGSPPLDVTGIGPLRFGQPAAELSGLGLQPLPFGQEDRDVLGCQVWFRDPERVPPELAGLGRVLTSGSEVVAIRLDGGGTAEGLQVGDPAESVLRAYPELAVPGVDGDLLPPFPAPLSDGRRLGVELRTPTVMPSSVDAPVPSDGQVVASIEVSTAGCDE